MGSPGGSTGRDARSHVYRHEVDIPAERRLLHALVAPGTRALDVGCAATGRSARLLRDLGADVTAIEINHDATSELATGGGGESLALVTADMTRLPFRDASFDVVLVAFHGYDYLLFAEDRCRTAGELARVVVPGGHVVLNTFNRPVCAFNVDGRPTRRMLRHRLSYFRQGGPFRPSFVDLNGLRIRQGALWRTRREIEASSSLRLERVVTRSGRVRPWAWATVMTPEPYLLFERQGS